MIRLPRFFIVICIAMFAFSIAASTSAQDTAPTLALGLIDVSAGTNSWVNVNADGSNPVPLTLQDVSQFSTAAYSPDGQHIAYLNNSFQIVVAGGDGSNPVTVTPTGEFASTFAWLPDSQHVSYFKGTSIVSVDISSSEVKDLFPFSTAINSMVWSPDGKWLAYTVESEVHIVDSTGANDQVISPTSRAQKFVMWSPDSKTVAYAGVNQSDDSGIFLIDLATKQETMLLKYIGVIAAAGWSPDGTQFAFAGTPGASGNLYLESVKGGDPVPVKLPADVKGFVMHLAWRPVPGGSAATATP